MTLNYSQVQHCVRKKEIKCVKYLEIQIRIRDLTRVLIPKS